MSTERPLHVQVAEALGWVDIEDKDGVFWGTEPHGKLRIAVPRYDSSWCSVGPLIERFQITVNGETRDWQDEWEARGGGFSADGSQPCEAIAKLIVKLKKEGKLNV